jgi:hypothetical protein
LADFAPPAPDDLHGLSAYQNNQGKMMARNVDSAARLG